MEADGLIDFDDMLLLTWDLMTRDQSALAWLRERYHYILVDEYQDTNFLLRDIIALLAGEDGNLAVAGDDDQSIYALRGARPEIMLEFKCDYPQAKEVYVTTNCRSDREIIRRAGRLIRNNTNRFPKKFLASSRAVGSVEYRDSTARNEELGTLPTPRPWNWRNG